MGNPTGFIKIKRESMQYRPVKERLNDYSPVVIPRPVEKTRGQAERCMDCGTDFCSWGCPLGNHIPEWNDHAYRERWKGAFRLLSETNILPEVTGRVCPAPCESACVLGINDSPVTIRENEYAIAEQAFALNAVKPAANIKRSGKKAAVIGSGPAGLAAAVNLNLMGHKVTVFEKDDRIGGFLRYGIPDFKLEKNVLERRIAIWEEEGIIFKTGIEAGTGEYGPEYFKNRFDAVVIAPGCRVARELPIPGRELMGIHQACDYLEQANRLAAGDAVSSDKLIDAKDKNVLVIGGGDTGSDCVGTANRQGAKRVIQIEIMPEPPKERPADQPWPEYPFVFKTSSSHQEGVERKFNVLTKEFSGKDGAVAFVKASIVKWSAEKGQRMQMTECKDGEFDIKADLVLLSMGFTNPAKEGLLENFSLKLNSRGCVIRDPETGATDVKGVFAAGDVSRGPSLVVWALREGRLAAEGADKFLNEK
ncbi:MAG: glutamate synthase subunit beta [Candidatus Goldiibacteriota bacterium]